MLESLVWHLLPDLHAAILGFYPRRRLCIQPALYKLRGLAIKKKEKSKVSAVFLKIKRSLSLLIDKNYSEFKFQYLSRFTF